MGHDITLVNKAGKEIGYVRFSAWDYTSSAFYDLFDAQKCNGGVSGYGVSEEYCETQMKKAYQKFIETNGQAFSYLDKDVDKYQKSVILSFLKNGVEAAEKDGTVRIYYQ